MYSKNKTTTTIYSGQKDSIWKVCCVEMVLWGTWPDFPGKGDPWRVTVKILVIVAQPITVCGPLQLTPMPSFLCLCPCSALAVLVLDTSVPATALGVLISTSWLFGRHWTSLRGKGDRAQSPNQPGVLFFLSVLAEQSLQSSSLREEGNLLRVENQRRFVC